MRLDVKLEQRTIAWLLIVVLLVLAPAVQAQGDPPPRPEAAFLAFRCEFVPETNSSRIRAVLTGADGEAMAPADYTLELTTTDTGTTIEDSALTLNPVTERDPLRLIVVLDITDTVPLPEIVTAIEGNLLANLLPEDEVALITFSDSVSPLTQFYTDKERLAADQLRGLTLGEGDNRLYDAVLQAVSSFTPSDTQRQAVLVITDSGRRAVAQATTPAIIEAAQASGVQIFTIGYFYEDEPDPGELQQLAAGTEGYNWLFDGTRSRDVVGVAVAGFLRRFINTLNSEITIDVSMNGLLPGQTADSQSTVRGGQFTIDMGRLLQAGDGSIGFRIAIDPANDAEMSDTIECPVEILNHSITFTNIADDTVTTEPLNIEVNAQSDMSLDGMTIAFWVNDSQVQNSTAATYTLNAPDLQPGPYSIRAQLRGPNGEVLATTPPVRVYAKQIMELSTVGGEVTDLDGIVRFEALTNPNLTLPPVEFRVGSAENPNITYPFGPGSAPVRDQGRAILTITNIRSELERIFPDGFAEPLSVSAFIPGAAPDRPLLAESNVLDVFLLPPPPPPVAQTQVLILIPVAISLFFLLINLLLIRSVGNQRIRKLINRPDNHGLTDRLMTITVRKDGMRKAHLLTKKTMFVGRGSTNDINLGDDPTISRQHGVVMWRRNAWYYANRKSGIKTRINGRKYVGYALFKLEPVTEMEIGSAHLIFHSNAQQDISELTKTNL